MVAHRGQRANCGRESPLGKLARPREPRAGLPTGPEAAPRAAATRGRRAAEELLRM